MAYLPLRGFLVGDDNHQGTPRSHTVIHNFRSYLTLAGARPNSAAGLMVDAATGSVALGNGCTFYLTTSMLLAPTRTDATGRASVPLVIPDKATLQGLSVYTQFVIADDPYGAYLGLLSFSDGLHMVIGK